MKYNAGKGLGRFQRLSMHQAFAICGRVTILENYDQGTVEAPKREQIGASGDRPGPGIES